MKAQNQNKISYYPVPVQPVFFTLINGAFAYMRIFFTFLCVNGKKWINSTISLTNFDFEHTKFSFEQLYIYLTF